MCQSRSGARSSWPGGHANKAGRGSSAVGACSAANPKRKQLKNTRKITRSPAGTLGVPQSGAAAAAETATLCQKSGAQPACTEGLSKSKQPRGAGSKRELKAYHAVWETTPTHCPAIRGQLKRYEDAAPLLSQIPDLQPGRPRRQGHPHRKVGPLQRLFSLTSCAAEGWQANATRPQTTAWRSSPKEIMVEDETHAESVQGLIDALAQ